MSLNILSDLFLVLFCVQVVCCTSFAKQTTIVCHSKQNYPSIELTADDSILTKPGKQQAKLKGLKKSVKVSTDFEDNSLKLSITSKSGNKTILFQVQSPDQAANAWDGAGTMTYGPDLAAKDFKKTFGESTNEKVMIVQQFSKNTIYPKTGGFCVMQISP